MVVPPVSWDHNISGLAADTLALDFALAVYA